MGSQAEINRGELVEEALKIAAKQIARYSSEESMRAELDGPATEAIAQAINKWDGRIPFPPYCSKIIRWRLQDYFRKIDPLTKDQRERFKRETQACRCGMTHQESGYEMKCPQCGHRFVSLTEQEIRVWGLLSVDGLSVLEIAKLLEKTPHAITICLAGLREKLGIKADRNGERRGQALLVREWYRREMKAADANEKATIR